MGRIFYVYYKYLKYEVYLLDDWGEAKDGRVSKWVQTITTMGVEGGSGNFLLVCNIDCKNIAWTRKNVLVSIMIELW